MADISAFPTIRNVLWLGNNFYQMTASGAITAGQVVAIDATGVSVTVRAAVYEAGEFPIGVALYTVADGEEVTIAGDGCIVYVANADDTTGIDAGDALQANDATPGGTVNAVALSESGAVAVTKWACGYAVDDIAGGGTGRMKVLCHVLTAVNTA